MVPADGADLRAILGVVSRRSRRFTRDTRRGLPQITQIYAQYSAWSPADHADLRRLILKCKSRKNIVGIDVVLSTFCYAFVIQYHSA